VRYHEPGTGFKHAAYLTPQFGLVFDVMDAGEAHHAIEGCVAPRQGQQRPARGIILPRAVVRERGAWLVPFPDTPFGQVPTQVTAARRNVSDAHPGLEIDLR